MATLPAGGETGPVPGYRLVAATFTTCTVKSSARSWFVRVKTMMALPETAAPPSTSRSGVPGTSAFQLPQALPATAVQAGVAAPAAPAIQAVTPRTARAIAAASAMKRLRMEAVSRCRQVKWCQPYRRDRRDGGLQRVYGSIRAQARRVLAPEVVSIPAGARRAADAAIAQALTVVRTLAFRPQVPGRVRAVGAHRAALVIVSLRRLPAAQNA